MFNNFRKDYVHFRRERRSSQSKGQLAEKVETNIVVPVPISGNKWFVHFCFWFKQLENRLYHSFMYSFVSLLSGTYLF